MSIFGSFMLIEISGNGPSKKGSDRAKLVRRRSILDHSDNTMSRTSDCAIGQTRMAASRCDQRNDLQYIVVWSPDRNSRPSGRYIPAMLALKFFNFTAWAKGNLYFGHV